ncbi:leucine--tRNA ligase [Martiniozyma asiatica (nom. inval.)]|nr:leucine--tRNA ligase [Martiniozyma asiatica]
MSIAKAVVMENTSRRDALIDIESKYQKLWEQEKPHEVNAPTNTEIPYGTTWEELHEQQPKYMGSMAYPYMNGVLHAGHAFTYSKVEFAVGFERLRGKKALFPLGFHCTGMPICASADKLKREIELFGEDFSGNIIEEEKETETDAPATNAKADPTKFTAKKSKVAQKTGNAKYQYEIMQQLGIPTEEIVKFADPAYWLTYFPPLVKKHVTALGGSVDWRRSMITTDCNPYYDAFIRWQMNRLREIGKIKFGKRFTIYSVKDGQPCMDHDRQSGEAVLPQEYTGIKIEVTEFNKEAVEAFKSQDFNLEGKKVYLVAATLRPETMYGQTCCFVSPKINYGVFDAGNNEYFICTERAFKNMCYQDLTPKRGDYTSTATINGSLLVGSKIHAPLAVHETLRVLPMDTILETKGTGVVTCVPSDSPDDYVTTRDLFNKPEYYNINKEWVIEEPVAIVNTKYGDKCAEFLVKDMKINSPKDAVQLASAKELAYKEGFYNGTLIIGKYAGEKVEVAKTKVKNDLVASGEAIVYSEPENVVISRSGDSCIVSLEDQWYLDYGEENWKAQAIECLEQMKCFHSETKNAFEGVLDWLKNWALSRTYGLGTRIPWDEKYLVESLSDSTVYQSFYTISHLLHNDFYGEEIGPLNIKPEEMTDEVFDYIFCRADSTEGCPIPKEKLDLMRREFEYFYPMDQSISGKDLIPNHLTFYIYCHTALFSKTFWPAGIRCNGHLMLNNAKMSKSTGNFRTLSQLVEKFGADATRIAFADSGDTVEDANFDETNANAAIMRLFNLKEWFEEMVKEKDTLRTGEFNFFDKAFDNEMNTLLEESYKNFDITYYKAALKSGLFDFQYARDFYREVTSSTGLGMHKDLVFKFIEYQTIILSPYTPHFSDYVYREILNNEGSIHTARWPVPSSPVSNELNSALSYVRDLQRTIRESEGQALKKKKGGKAADLDKDAPSKLVVYVSSSFPEWQEKFVSVAKSLYEEGKLNDNKELKNHIDGKEMKRAMPFISELKKQLAIESPEKVFNRELIFDELDVIKQSVEILKKAPTSCNVTEVEIISFENGSATGQNAARAEVEIPSKVKSIENAVPGQPAVLIKNL